MTVSEALLAASAAGVEIKLNGDNLDLEASSPPPSSVLDALSRHKAEIVILLRSCEVGWSARAWQAFYDERAGIAEFDGGQSRQRAEGAAYESCVVEWLNHHPCRSEHGLCAACGEPDRKSLTVVPFGTESSGHTWLHPECWQDWRVGRRAEAVAALATMGIMDPTGQW